MPIVNQTGVRAHMSPFCVRMRDSSGTKAGLSAKSLAPLEFSLNTPGIHALTPGLYHESINMKGTKVLTLGAVGVYNRAFAHKHGCT